MYLQKLSNKKGASLVLVAISIFTLVAIVALVIDIGRLYVAKQRAQNVADASAIAGAWLLDGTAACTSPGAQPEATAQQVALHNNTNNPSWIVTTLEGAEGVDVDFPTTFQADDGSTITVPIGNAIRVQCRTPVSHLFARVFGGTQSQPKAEAVVIRTSVNSFTHPFVPWVVADTTIWDTSVEPPVPKLSLGDDPTVLKIVNPKSSDNFIGPGNFLCVAYEGDSGGNDYRDRIKGLGDPVTIDTDGTIELSTEPGNMIGPTFQGLEYRLSQDTVFPSPAEDATAFEEWRSIYESTGEIIDTPRIIIVPIAEDPGGDLSGRKELNVVGFAAFFIESFDRKDGTVTGRFLSGTTNGDVTRWNFGDAGTSDRNLLLTLKLVT
jgi:Flp pilus assembly protein TadG